MPVTAALLKISSADFIAAFDQVLSGAPHVTTITEGLFTVSATAAEIALKKP